MGPGNSLFPMHCRLHPFPIMAVMEVANLFGSAVAMKHGEHIPAMKQALHLSLGSPVSFVDALVCSTARQHGWKTKSFDKKLNKLVKSEK